jgi:hypothetical protein
LAALLGGCELYSDSGHPVFASAFDQASMKKALQQAEQNTK